MPTAGPTLFPKGIRGKKEHAPYTVIWLILKFFLFAFLPGAKQIKLLNTLAPQKEEQIHRQASKKSLSAFFSSQKPDHRTVSSSFQRLKSVTAPLLCDNF